MTTGGKHMIGARVEEVVGKRTLEQMVEELDIGSLFYKFDDKVGSYVWKMKMRIKYGKGFKRRHDVMIRDMYYTMLATGSQGLDLW